MILIIISKLIFQIFSLQKTKMYRGKIIKNWEFQKSKFLQKSQDIKKNTYIMSEIIINFAIK